MRNREQVNMGVMRSLFEDASCKMHRRKEPFIAGFFGPGESMNLNNVGSNIRYLSEFISRPPQVLGRDRCCDGGDELE